MTSHDPRFGFLQNGRLHLVASDGSVSEIHSEFVKGLKARIQNIHEKSSWKSRGAGGMFMRGGLPGGPDDGPEFVSEFSAASAGVEPGTVCYAIDARDVRALFSRTLADGHEGRVVHGPKHRFTTIAPRVNDETEEWLLAAATDDGTSRVGMYFPGRGGGVRELTEGDCIDSHPVWVPGPGRRISYQSSGLARDSNGHMAGLGPATIESVDLDTGHMETLLEDPHRDFLCPAYDREGRLYYLERPYEPFHRASPGKLLLDIVCFPYRLIRAIVAFLNTFSMFFSGKPLHTAGVPNRTGPDPKAVFLYGRWVNLNKQMRKQDDDTDASVVAQSWVLKRRSANGAETTDLAAGVLAYTTAEDGTVYYSNGKAIFRIPPGGKPEKVISRPLATGIFAF